MFKLLARKLLGERYSGAVKSVLVSVILGCGLHQTGVVLPLAQSVLILSAVCFSGSIIVQTLVSRENACCLKGLFAMPHNDRRTLWEYAAAIGAYVLCTRTSILAALLFAFIKLSPIDIVIFFLCFLYALFGGMAAYGLFRRMPVVSVLLAAAPVLMALLLPKGIPAVIAFAAADLVAGILFSVLHLDDFYVQESSKLKGAVHRSKTPKMLILRYIVRYFLANKAYLVSMLGMIVFGCFFAIMTEKQGIAMGCGFGLAFVSLNTPLTTIVSANRGLNRKLSALPDKTNRFFVPYAVVQFCCNILVYTLFLCVFAAVGGKTGIRAVLTALLFAAESAVFAAFLEDRFPITKWKTEPDLWHHPRKYILPVLLVLEAGLIFMT